MRTGEELGLLWTLDSVASKCEHSVAITRLKAVHAKCGQSIRISSGLERDGSRRQHSSSHKQHRQVATKLHALIQFDLNTLHRLPLPPPLGENCCRWLLSPLKVPLPLSLFKSIPSPLSR